MKAFRFWAVCAAGLVLVSTCSTAEDVADLDTTDPKLCFSYPGDLDYQADAVLDACNQIISDSASHSTDDIFEAYYSRGLTLREKGDLAGSRADLETALEIDTQRDDVMRMLGWTYREMGDHEYALELFDRAIELAPKEPQGYLSRCVITGTGLGNYQSALDDCKMVMSLGVISEDVIFFTSQAQNQLRAFSETVDLIERYFDSHTVSARVFIAYIDALLELGEEQKASRALATALTEFPEHEELNSMRDALSLSDPQP